MNKEATALAYSFLPIITRGDQMNEKDDKVKVFRSVIEVEQEFLPRSYNEKIEQENLKEPGAFGSELARKILEEMKRQLGD
jgi:hypothetical protein